jgi:hypothetical protein
MPKGALLLILMAAAAFRIEGQIPSLRSEIVARLPAGEMVELVLQDRERRTFHCGLNTAPEETTLRTGDVVEWSGVPGPDGRGCQIRSIRVLGHISIPSASEADGRVRLDLNPLNPLIRRGNLSYGGVVTAIAPRQLELRKRTGEREVIVLRPDTHFFANGLPAGVDEVVLNQRVSIRAGRNVDGQLEAFFVMWGGILRPGGNGEDHGPGER